jgi:ADP-ribose pyrophosphatase YjhB (NUDIX family)
MSDREYPARPFVGIGIVVIKDDHVLLCQRGKPPNLGSWTLPGGAQDLGETCEEAARRELMEECGLAVGDLHFCAHVETGVCGSTTRSWILPRAGWRGNRWPRPT